MAIKNMVHVVRLGRMAYNPALRIQNWYQDQLIHTPGAPQTLLLVEHDPVYTLGFREKLEPDVEEKLTKIGAEVVKSNRGGLTTFHGPGQLVAYPILHLSKWKPELGLRVYVKLLEDVAVHTCRSFGIPARLSSEDVSHTGAWVGDNKICAVGVHFKRHVTTHGLALNCNVDLDWYKHIVPCGIRDKGVTSISKELQQEMTVQGVESQFLASFQSIFKCGLCEHDVEAAAMEKFN